MEGGESTAPPLCQESSPAGIARHRGDFGGGSSGKLQATTRRGFGWWVQPKVSTRDPIREL